MRGFAMHHPARYAVAILVAVSALALVGCVAAPTSSVAGTQVPGQQTDAPPARTTPVPAPSGGTTKQVIDSGQAGAVTKVAFTEPAELNGGVTVSVLKITPMEAKAKTPGEVDGAALAIQVKITNDSKKAIDVNSTIVTLTDSKGDLGQPTTSTPYRAFSGTIAPGKSGEGVYVFLIPQNDRHGLTLSVAYVAGAPIAHFTGAVS